MIRQTEASECGLACPAMVANHHGRQVDLGTLRRRFPISLKGATLKALMEIGAAMGFGARPVQKLTKRIVLIDGEQLAARMLQFGVGARIEERVEIKKIDEDYFSLDA